jgi:ectoine hydroxylase-related dioxygenase (phytanoyl-CoA dioxygenase family)
MRLPTRLGILKDRAVRACARVRAQKGLATPPLPEVAWYMDLGARGKQVWRGCPLHIKEELSFFLEHGYVVLNNSVPPKVIERARTDFYAHKKRYADAYERHEDANGYQRRIVNLHMALDSFKELYTKNRKALDIQDYLFQRPSACYSSLTFESGSEQEIHRDSPYFRTTPEYYYLGVWVSLEAADEKNGALMVYDGGHLLHEPDREAIYARYYKRGDRFNDLDSRLWNDYQAMVAVQCERHGLKKKTIPMSPGDTLIWHPHLPHGGAPIIERHRSRFSVVSHVLPVDVPVSGQAVFYGHAGEPRSINYDYEDFDGRKFLRHRVVQFAHTDPQPVNDFRL